ncbi:hypothetical protein DID80_03275 [Candidatus Marinamargulisbacteria bacterium SCGC AAA071-K20]|nr:hypothetical protein DID80_03275 [Candidatus Marinamargulisbacteria bacterium SCGC AAA071-K20]
MLKIIANSYNTPTLYTKLGEFGSNITNFLGRVHHALSPSTYLLRPYEDNTNYNILRGAARKLFVNRKPLIGFLGLVLFRRPLFLFPKVTAALSVIIPSLFYLKRKFPSSEKPFFSPMKTEPPIKKNNFATFGNLREVYNFSLFSFLTPSELDLESVARQLNFDPEPEITDLPLPKLPPHDSVKAAEFKSLYLKMLNNESRHAEFRDACNEISEKLHTCSMDITTVDRANAEGMYSALGSSLTLPWGMESGCNNPQSKKTFKTKTIHDLLGLISKNMLRSDIFTGTNGCYLDTFLSLFVRSPALQQDLASADTNPRGIDISNARNIQNLTARQLAQNGFQKDLLKGLLNNILTTYRQRLGEGAHTCINATDAHPLRTFLTTIGFSITGQEDTGEIYAKLMTVIFGNQSFSNVNRLITVGKHPFFTTVINTHRYSRDMTLNEGAVTQLVRGAFDEADRDFTAEELAQVVNNSHRKDRFTTEAQFITLSVNRLGWNRVKGEAMALRNILTIPESITLEDVAHQTTRDRLIELKRHHSIAFDPDLIPRSGRVTLVPRLTSRWSGGNSGGGGHHWIASVQEVQNTNNVVTSITFEVIYN